MAPQDATVEKQTLYSKSGAIATITLNRPEKYNTLRPSLLADLDDALRELTFRAACGCLSRGRAALGSNPSEFVHTSSAGKHKRARKGPFRIYWRRGWD